MTEVTIQVPDNLQRQLQKRADDQSRELEAVVVDILETGLRHAPAVSPEPKLSPEEWVKEFRKWVKSIPQVNMGFVDDSRESIYEGRGE